MAPSGWPTPFFMRLPTPWPPAMDTGRRGGLNAAGSAPSPSAVTPSKASVHPPDRRPVIEWGADSAIGGWNDAGSPIGVTSAGIARGRWCIRRGWSFRLHKGEESERTDRPGDGQALWGSVRSRQSKGIKNPMRFFVNAEGATGCRSPLGLCLDCRRFRVRTGNRRQACRRTVRS